MPKPFFVLLLSLSAPALGQSPDLPRADDAPGWIQASLQAAQVFAENHASTSGLVVEHDRIVFSWGDIARPSNIHSCRKSLLSALVGIAVEKKQLDLGATLASLDIDDIPPSLSNEEKQARVVDLLEARSGVYHPAAYETKGMKEKRPERGSHAPGTFWYYNNWDFNTLGSIYEHATGRSIFEAFDAQIAKPIGMQDFTPRDGHYRLEQVSRYPAYLFDLSARDFARFGLLYLHGGRWNGAQVVPADWVAASVRPASDTHSGGYGYLWWTANSATGKRPHIAFPKGSYWAEGHLGQYAVVIPSLDLVIVSRVDPSLTKSEMSKPEMAELVQLILAAKTTP
jgi:CubicO group peptidase (beta-lactamase class C family)